MLFLDLLILIAVTTCIAYSILLVKRINEFHNSKVEITKMMKLLDATISRAEDNVENAQEISSAACDKLKSLISSAIKIENNLVSSVKVSKKILASDKIDNQEDILKHTTHAIINDPQVKTQIDVDEAVEFDQSVDTNNLVESDNSNKKNEAVHSKDTNKNLLNKNTRNLKDVLQEIIVANKDSNNDEAQQMNFYDFLKNVTSVKK
ncbi:hypothetical protein [Rickettsia endosymbiont of Cardiosporidium cionae]|uniref:hypothetical protein n=1 Tax=Rickettsia endosymbiont of Cardiosporidium cionae TaxID=2777155 RepID=UPI0018939C2E|nr:hypothetical protein [Rickettsia endosymbiont of Cardiosporidium cionae]KAF8818597.1 hypothetical protein IHI24_000316 [Rickettsia endosymbiont of Cardiosporidium cionae]